MKKVTTWSPDTCSCVFEYEWDTAESAATRQINFKNVVNRCPSHSALSGIALYNQVLSENTRKNYTFAEIQQIFPAAELENYNWSFDKGNLKVGILDLAISAAQKTQLQVALDNKFGAGMTEVI